MLDSVKVKNQMPLTFPKISRGPGSTRWLMGHHYHFARGTVMSRSQLPCHQDQCESCTPWCENVAPSPT